MFENKNSYVFNINCAISFCLYFLKSKKKKNIMLFLIYQFRVFNIRQIDQKKRILVLSFFH